MCVSSRLIPFGVLKMAYRVRRIYRLSQEERSIFWEVIVSDILSKTMYMYMFPIPDSFQDRAISLYSSKVVDKKEI
jgi:hypothetical protein